MDILNKVSSPSKKKTYSESIINQTPKKISHLIKPDFTSIILKENQFIPKILGSFKTKSNLFPESPKKCQNPNFTASVKIIGKDLFGIKKDKKINLENEKAKYDFNETYNNNIGLKKNLIDNLYNECVMENKFSLIKTIMKNKLDAMYKVREKETGQIFCLKKISKKSNKNNFNILEKTLEDIQRENKDWILPKTFCMKYLNYWVENKNYNNIKEDTNNLNKNIYILTQFYPNGDILEYLEQLEKNNFSFTPEFYWDIIFEMIIGLLYIHKKGYIHFDIKPTNYLVDNEGFILLNDFGLSHKEEELPFLNDIIEGDSKYISKELFECFDNNSLKKINNKTDIFSLGLTFLEILAKIDLPMNGQLWRDLRNKGGNVINISIFINANIVEIENFFILIKKMIAPVDDRPNLIELIKETNELNKRYVMLEKNNYKKSFLFGF